MDFLVDTNVISAAAPMRAAATELVGWMDRNSRRLYLSAITITEIEAGVAKARRQGATAKASALNNWLEGVLILYSNRILPFDAEAARIAGRIGDAAVGRGLNIEFADVAIAATAERHGLMLLSQNLRDFIPLGVAVHDPYAALPD